MGTYHIVLDKRNGQIHIDGNEFTGLDCLEFLEKLKLGKVRREEFKSSSLQLVDNPLVSLITNSEDA